MSKDNLNRKGIILAGGSGSRLFPLTKVVSKQLLPIYDKPMIYYPLSVIMLSEIKDILIISTPQDLPKFESLLGNGSRFGINIQYAEQAFPNGLAEAFILGEAFLDGSPSVLILGDNIFYGDGLSAKLLSASKRVGASIFGYHVNDPTRYGIATFDKKYKVTNIEEKPKKPKSNYAVTGLYYYDGNAPKYAKSLKPSSRGELEITDLNKVYLKKKKLTLEVLGRGFSWFDTGTHNSLLEAQQFVKSIENRQGQKIACLEEIAYHKKWITKKKLTEIASESKSEYYQYLSKYINK